MSTFTDILTELADIQPILSNESFKDGTKLGLCKSLCAKIANLGSLAPKEALQLQSSISSLGDPHKDMLLEAVDARLASAVQGRAKADAKTQLLTAPLDFLTASDWEKINNPQANAGAIMSVIASRYAQLGIRSLNEQTVKYSIMLVLHMIKLKTAKWPEYETIWKWVNDFKK